MVSRSVRSRDHDSRSEPYLGQPTRGRLEKPTCPSAKRFAGTRVRWLASAISNRRPRFWFRPTLHSTNCVNHPRMRPGWVDGGTFARQVAGGARTARTAGSMLASPKGNITFGQAQEFLPIDFAVRKQLLHLPILQQPDFVQEIFDLGLAGLGH